MNARSRLAARRLALLALLGASCRGRSIEPEGDQGSARRPERRPPQLRPLASLAPAPAGAPWHEVSAACSAERAARGAARYDWGEQGPPLVSAASSADWRSWMKLAKSDPGGSPGIKLCYTKSADACRPVDEVRKTSYSDVCCETIGLGERASGPTVERVTFPEACAGVLACCYEGEGAFGSGPGRPLRVAGGLRLAPLQRGG